MGALVYKTREACISYLKGLAMWTVLNVLRRWFPVNWPKIENRIRLFLMRRKIAIVWPMRNLDRDRIITCHDPSWDYIGISNLELCAYEVSIMTLPVTLPNSVSSRVILRARSTKRFGKEALSFRHVRRL